MNTLLASRRVNHYSLLRTVPFSSLKPTSPHTRSLRQPFSLDSTVVRIFNNSSNNGLISTPISSPIARFMSSTVDAANQQQQQQQQHQGQEATTTTTTTTSPTTENTDPEQEKKAKKQRRRKRLTKLFLFLVGSYVVFKTFAYIVLISEDNAFVMNNTTESLMKKLPLNALSRAWGWIYSTEVPEFARPIFYSIYAFLFDANLDEVEKPLKHYRSLQDFFTRKLKHNTRQISDNDELVSPVDGRVMSCGVVHINSDTEDVVVEQVKGISYPLHHFLGYGMKDALLALDTAAHDVVQDENRAHPRTHFLPDNTHEKTLYYCVLYLAPGDYHRYHSPCDWRVQERKHVAGYLFPVMPLFVKTLRGLFALNERVVLHGKWKHGDFHYVMVGATNVGSMTLYFDNTLNTNIKRKRAPKKKATPKKTEKKSEEEGQSQDLADTTQTDKVEEKKEHIEDQNHHQFDKYLEMRRREYAKNGIALSKGEDIGYFKMGSTIVMLFEHKDEKKQFEWGIKPGERVLLGEPLSAESRREHLQRRGE